MAIPLSKDFNITANVISAAGSALNANGLILTDSDMIAAGSVQSFTLASEVSALLGSSSNEYAAASIYFAGYDNSSTTPGKLLMARIQTTASAGWLMGASLKGVKIATIQALGSGTITLSVDGTSQTSDTINLSSATSFSNAASLIEAGLTGVSVSWNSTANRFIITSSKTGADSAVSFATDGTLATGLLLTEDTGATESAGFAATSLTDTMANIIDLTQDFVGFSSVTDFTDDEKIELAAWVATTENRYFYSMHDTSATALVADSTSSFVPNTLDPDTYPGVFPVYGSYLYAVMPLAYAASLNFDATRGRVTFKFRSFSGLDPVVSTLSAATALESNGYNYYGSYKENTTEGNYAATGYITGDFLWLDSYIDEIWIKANLISAFYTLFTSNQSYAFNAQGYASVQAAVIDVATTAKTFGAIQTGVDLSTSQIRQVTNVVGKDVSSALYSDGYYLYIPTQTSANRTARKLAGVVFYYVDGQMIQSIDMSSTAIL